MNTDFYLKELEFVVGGTIVGLAHTSEPGCWAEEYFGLVIDLPSGKRVSLLLLSDDEGNSPGSFEIRD